jgi:integrase
MLTQASTTPCAAEKYRCHIAVFSTGERFPVLLYGGSCEPVSLVTRYVIDERRENKQASTIARDVRVLRWFYEWCDRTNLQIEQRLRDGKLLTTAEVTSFCRYLRVKRNSSVVGSIDLNQTNDKALPILSPQTFNSYLGVIQEFLLWAAYEFVPTTTPAGTVRDTLRNAVDRLNRVFRSNTKTGKMFSERSGLSTKEIETIRGIIQPDAPNNPFKKTVRFRNSLIFELMLATGIRRGELLKLKLEHLPVGVKTTLSIIRCPDDATDPRRNEPQVKTRIREIPLHKKLARSLWMYVHQHRRVNTKGHSYLFTGTRGEPLSLGAVNWVFSSIVGANPSELEGRLCPHVMRHSFNEHVVTVADTMGFNQQQIEDLQRYLNGWSESSEMPAHYTRRRIEERAMQIAARYQDELYAF